MSLQNKRPDLSDASSLSVAKEACRVLLQKLSEDVKLISTEGSALTDYFVVGYGRSSTQVRALANDTMDALAACGVLARRHEGLDSADWALLDFGDVIVHVFGREAAAFYRFERLFKPEAFVSLADVREELDKDE